MTATSVSDWVTGKSKNIEYDHAIKAAEFLGVDPTWLRTGEGEQYPSSNHINNKVDEAKNAYNSNKALDVEGAMEVIRVALVGVDELTRAQAKPIIDALFLNPEQSQHLGARMSATLNTIPNSHSKRQAA